VQKTAPLTQLNPATENMSSTPQNALIAEPVPIPARLAQHSPATIDFLTKSGKLRLSAFLRIDFFKIYVKIILSLFKEVFLLWHTKFPMLASCAALAQMLALLKQFPKVTANTLSMLTNASTAVPAQQNAPLALLTQNNF
jgi:hypothetical protein